jgi:hypothetical protein
MLYEFLWSDLEAAGQQCCWSGKEWLVLVQHGIIGHHQMGVILAMERHDMLGTALHHLLVHGCWSAACSSLPGKRTALLQMPHHCTRPLSFPLFSLPFSLLFVFSFLPALRSFPSLLRAPLAGNTLPSHGPTCCSSSCAPCA